jgi:peptidoglycan hydrolase CwlO-like protein
MNLKDLFSGKKKALEQQVEDLKSALEECSSKLAEKQEHINTTNAYWKKKLKEQTTTKPARSKPKKDS